MAAQNQQPNLTDYSGLRTEVLNPEGTLLFLGRLRIIEESLGEVERTSELFAEPEEEQIVQLRGFHQDLNQGVHLTARIRRLSPGRDQLWVLEKPEVTRVDPGRAFRRRQLTAEGQTCLRKEADRALTPCAIGNISAGGLCVRLNRVFQKGDPLRVRIHLKAEQPELPCVIRRVTERGPGDYEYGCQFTDITPDVERSIARTVIELQLRQQARDEGSSPFAIAPPPF